jgi:hypothetical protein
MGSMLDGGRWLQWTIGQEHALAAGRGEAQRQLRQTCTCPWLCMLFFDAVAAWHVRDEDTHNDRDWYSHFNWSLQAQDATAS